MIANIIYLRITQEKWEKIQLSKYSFAPGNYMKSLVKREVHL